MWSTSQECTMCTKKGRHRNIFFVNTPLGSIKKPNQLLHKEHPTRREFTTRTPREPHNQSCRNELLARRRCYRSAYSLAILHDRQEVSYLRPKGPPQEPPHQSKRPPRSDEEGDMGQELTKQVAASAAPTMPRAPRLIGLISLRRHYSSHLPTLPKASSGKGI